ncbi:BLOC-2 complex member HPS6, partial [Aplochiton taeniatus]
TNSCGDGSAALLAVVFENGKAEFWKFLECKAGWHLLQTSDLCNSPRSKVVSVSACSNLIIWCEERPPSESSSAVNTSNYFRYCICKRPYEVDEGAVVLGGVKIALHNNPRYVVVSSGENAYLLPDPKEKPPLRLASFFLTWDPQHDTFRVGSTCKGIVQRKDSTLAKDSDFKRLIADCLGYLSALDPPDIYGFSPSSGGGLLLLLSSGWVCLLQRDGMLRQVYKLADNCPVNGGSHVSLSMYHGTLALTIGRTLYLIDSKCGRELEKISLKREGILYTDRSEAQAPHLLSELGLFAVMHRESDPRGHDSEPRPRPPALGTAESIRPGALLVEAVFEEACKYYQQRSLSSTQLTVEKLKKGGMFQAPISLASIVRDYLSGGGGPRGAELPQGNGSGGGGGQDKLLGSLEAELKGLVSLEEVKGSLVRGKEKEVQALCESLVQQEVARLLSSPELERQALLYLNSIFSLFPCPAWRATQAAMQLTCNREGSLSSRAPPEVWKTVLTPAPSSPANLPHTNGQTKRKPSLHKAASRSSPSSCPPAANLALPVFELLCHSVFHFQASWLPRFLELAQQQQGSAGLGLSLSSSWGYSGGRGGEAGESSQPLYKRALSVLPAPDRDPDRSRNQELEVELLLVSGRPNAVLQALRLLMGRQQWERVTALAQRFCKQSPLLNKEIFTTLLCEVAQHRDLDPYLELLWALCPEDLTVTAILNMVLKNIPSSNPPSSPSSSPAPFAEPRGSQLTIGLLKPLLRKVLQRETKPSQRYADILQSPSFPPPTPPRQAAEPPWATKEASLGPAPEPSVYHTAGPREELDQEPSKHRTVPLGTTIRPLQQTIVGGASRSTGPIKTLFCCPVHCFAVVVDLTGKFLRGA